MAILRNETNKKFTIINNAIFQNGFLSLKAIGMYGKLVSLPDNWKFTESGLVAICGKDGKDSVKSALKELENANLLFRFRLREKNGSLGESVYWIGTEPMTEQEKQKMMNRYNSTEILCITKNNVELPESENPTLAKPAEVNPQLLNTNILNTNKLNNISCSSGDEPSSNDKLDVSQSSTNCESSNSNRVEDNFSSSKVNTKLEINTNNNTFLRKKKDKSKLEQLNKMAESIWEEYPKKASKASSIKSIIQFLKGTKIINSKRYKLSFEQLLNATMDYAEEVEGRDRQYICQGSTFYNGRILDYIKEEN